MPIEYAWCRGLEGMFFFFFFLLQTPINAAELFVLLQGGRGPWGPGGLCLTSEWVDNAVQRAER